MVEETCHYLNGEDKEEMEIRRRNNANAGKDQRELDRKGLEEMV